MTKHSRFPTRLAEAETWADRADPTVWGDAHPCPHVTADEIARYERDGFLIKRGLFLDAEVRALIDAATALRNAPAGRLGDDAVREPGSDDLRTLFHLERHGDIFDRLSRSDRIAGIARRILDDQVYIHQSRLNYKPGFRGKEFYWHSDFETWHAEDGMPAMRAVSASVLLTDNSGQNGPLMLMPGSHKVFIGCEGETGADNHLTSLQRQDIGVPSPDSLTRLADRFGIETATGRAGTVIFFDCNTMHGSNGNITPFPRSNAFFVYNAVSNALAEPFAAPARRPEYLANRDSAQPLRVEKLSLN